MRNEPAPVNPLVELTEDEQGEIAKQAAAASWFRGSLPKSLDKLAESLTILFLDWWVNKRKPVKRAARLRLGPPVEEPRGEGNLNMQVHSTRQLAIPVAGEPDADGAPTRLVGLSVASSDENQIDASIQDRGGQAFIICADDGAGNLGTSTITVTADGCTPSTFDVEVVPLDATIISVGAPTEEARP